jgi:hypothetical protein
MFSSPLPRRYVGPLSLGLLISAFIALPGQASADPTACNEEEFSQPFLYAGDSHYYTSLPGESADSFEGAGWQFSGGAQVVSEQLADGSTGPVLDLPSGSKAVSPVICVTQEYPTARALVRNVKGAEGVFFYVEYEGTNTWNHPKNTGQIHGNGTSWTLVTPVNLQPASTSDYQYVRITLIPGGKTSDFELYDLFVDPRMR